MNYVFLLDLILGGWFISPLCYLFERAQFGVPASVCDRRPDCDAKLDFHVSTFFEDFEVVPESCKRYGIGGAFCAHYGSDYAWAYLAFRPWTS
jgi:hypothetical protein